jgi:broad-specificity NMP kinase
MAAVLPEKTKFKSKSVDVEVRFEHSENIFNEQSETIDSHLANQMQWLIPNCIIPREQSGSLSRQKLM